MKDLHKLFTEQVERDNQQFDIESIYLPNPIYTYNPNFCFVAMEPSMGRMSPKRFRERLDQGFLNFLFSEEDFILHYCAYNYLCLGAFDYMITDVSKGAMKVKGASMDRLARYQNWKAALHKEYSYFGSPRLISIGKVSQKFLWHEGFDSADSIMHFSNRNRDRFLERQLRNIKFGELVGIHKKLSEFSETLLTKMRYEEALKKYILKKNFKNELTDWKKCLFLDYKAAFSSIRNS